GEAGPGGELGGEVGLSIGEAAAHRRADAWGHVRIERVHVEADVHEAGAGDVRKRLAHRALDAEAVDIAHRVDPRLEAAEELALALVERAHADERHAGPPDRGHG